MKNNNRGKNRVNNYIRFSGIGIQMGIIITAGALGGQWLDGKQGNEFPTWTLVLTLFAISTSLYIIIKEVIKMGKEDNTKD